MLIKYIGSRTALKTNCSGRKGFYFGPENDFTVDIEDQKAASELLSSRLHKFTVVIPGVIETKEVVKPVEKEVIKKEVIKKEGKKHGKKA